MTSELHYFWLRFCSLFPYITGIPFSCCFYPFFHQFDYGVPRYILCYAYLLTMVYQYHWDFDFIGFIEFEKNIEIISGNTSFCVYPDSVLSFWDINYGSSWFFPTIDWDLVYVYLMGFFLLCISTWIVSIPMSLN